LQSYGNAVTNGISSTSREVCVMGRQVAMRASLNKLFLAYGPDYEVLEKNAAASYFDGLVRPYRDDEALGNSFCKLASSYNREPWDLAFEIAQNFGALSEIHKTASGAAKDLLDFYLDTWPTELEKQALVSTIARVAKPIVSRVAKAFSSKAPAVAAKAAPRQMMQPAAETAMYRPLAKPRPQSSVQTAAMPAPKPTTGAASRTIVNSGSAPKAPYKGYSGNMHADPSALPNAFSTVTPLSSITPRPTPATGLTKPPTPQRITGVEAKTVAGGKPTAKAPAKAPAKVEQKASTPAVKDTVVDKPAVKAAPAKAQAKVAPTEPRSSVPSNVEKTKVMNPAQQKDLVRSTDPEGTQIVKAPEAPAKKQPGLMEKMVYPALGAAGLYSAVSPVVSALNTPASQGIYHGYPAGYPM
jgi:hypothetical protein